MFGERLKLLRKSRGITQEQLAEIIGVERSSIGKYEGKSKTIPSDDVKAKIADYFNVSTDYLLGRSDVAEPAKNQPIADGDELDRELIDLMRDLSPEDFQRVKDFVAGLKAARGASSSRRS